MSTATWRELHLPQSLPSDSARGFLRSLAADRSRGALVIEAVGQGGSVSYRLGGSPGALSDVGHACAAFMPGVEIGRVAGRPEIDLALRLHGRRLAAGIASDRAAEISRAVLSALATAREGETLLLQVVLGAGIPPQAPRSRPPDPRQNLWSHVVSGPRPAPPSTANQMREREGQFQLTVFIRLGAAATSVSRQQALLRALVAALRTALGPGTRFDFRPADANRLDALPQRFGNPLSVDELVGMLGWPLDVDSYPGLPAPHPKKLRLLNPPKEVTRVFGETDAPGDPLPIGLDIAGALYHSLILGPTGSGKSNLALSQIVADMEAGRGVVVVDPQHGLVDQILKRAPAHRRDDIVVLDPSEEHPVGFNPLHSVQRSPELVADSILTIFRDLYPEMFGPRVADVLQAVLVSLAQTPGSTLTWIVPLLTDAAFRGNVVRSLADDYLRDFWLQFEHLSPAARSQWVSPVLARLRRLVLNPSLRRVLDQPKPRFDLSDIFGERPRILLVRLNSGVISESVAAILGSLLVNALYDQILGRAKVPPSDREPVSIFVDEAPAFVRLGGELEEATARSRALGAAWTFMAQFLDQFSPAMRVALQHNARNVVSFAVQSSDAKTLAAEAPQLEPADFMGLEKFHYYARLVRDGHPAPWISGRTLPPGPVISDPVELRRRSQANYGRLATDTAPVSLPQTSVPPDTIGRRPRRRA